MSTAVPLAEVFTSFQGEGPLVGVCQLFVRVRGCDLACRGLAPVARAESRWHFFGKDQRGLAGRRAQSPLERDGRHRLFFHLGQTRAGVHDGKHEQRGHGLVL